MSFPGAPRIVEKIEGTADEIAVRLRRLLDMPRRDPTLAARAAAMRLRLAHLYGEYRGWRLSENEFQPSVLARRGRSVSGTSAEDSWPPQFLSHPYAYRRDRRAAALVCHSFRVDALTRKALREWASLKSLTISYPDDFPSWWYPTITTMYVFESATT